MKIGLIDVDGHNFPNLALMKISRYYKNKGDEVEFAQALFGKYDIIYKAKTFTFTADDTNVYNAKKIIKGGTGYDYKIKLPEEIDKLQPDYSLYNIENVSYGFLTRGCCNSCKWCIVPKKEGQIKPYMDIEEVAGDNNKIILMDNNILASEYGIKQLVKIKEKGYKIDLNQGIDCRLIDNNIAEILAGIKWLKYIRLACDTEAQIPYIEKAIELLNKYNYTKKIFVYCLLNDLNSSYYRINYFRKNNQIDMFCQPYRDFKTTNKIPQWQKDMARYVNKKWIYKTCTFEEYSPRINFKCKEYIKQIK